jgi:hypothetical protein
VKIQNVIASAAVMIATLATSASASYFKVDQGNGQLLVCADGDWQIRHSDGQPSGKKLVKGECMILLGAVSIGRYLRVRGASGNVWLLKATPQELIDARAFIRDCCEVSAPKTKWDYLADADRALNEADRALKAVDSAPWE